MFPTPKTASKSFNSQVIENKEVTEIVDQGFIAKPAQILEVNDAQLPEAQATIENKTIHLNLAFPFHKTIIIFCSCFFLLISSNLLMRRFIITL